MTLGAHASAPGEGRRRAAADRRRDDYGRCGRDSRRHVHSSSSSSSSWRG